MGDDRDDKASGSDNASQPVSIERFERATAEGRFALLVVLALLIAEFALIYIIYGQLKGHKQEYAVSEVVIYSGLILTVTVIAVAVIRIAVQQYKTPSVTIPGQDRKLLEELIRSENTKAIELYVRLASLGGPTGTATKLGLTGLPLATIGLTVFFTLMSLYESVFLDLAKLTLGAFIGSFVQRSGEAIERAVRAGSPSQNGVKDQSTTQGQSGVADPSVAGQPGKIVQ